jgi:uncharacterized damage-inducible protein DinB
MGSDRGATLAARLREAGDRLLAVIESIDEDRWRLVAKPGEWSIGKDAEHVVEGAAYHQWIVRLTIGEKVSSRRPSLERKQMTSDLSPAEAAELIRQRVAEGTRLILGLTDGSSTCRRSHRRRRRRLLRRPLSQS